MATTARARAHTSTYRIEFWRGVLAIAPIWAGAIPFAVTLAIMARTAGFSDVETVAMSGLMFAGAAQVAAVTLFSDGAGLLGITLAVFLLNLRHVLYGLSLDRQLPDHPKPARLLLAFFLTDESYGVTTRDHLDGRGGDAFYFGAALSTYVVYCSATVAGVLLGSFLPEPESIGLDFIFPLMFVALLAPLLRTRRQLVVAGLAGFTALTLGQVADGGTTILASTVVAASAGALLESS